ncbi:MAG: RAM signaling network component [Vezdaea aestivalis]|nr:MAG: RAM signaling network component [Vezdaea aestivalis]
MDLTSLNGALTGPPSKRSGNSQDSTGKSILSPSAPTSEPRTVRYAPAQHSGSQQPPISAPQVISLFAEALNSARETTKRSGAVVDPINGELKAGVTIELSRKNIQRVPEEAIDLMKTDIERLALNFNQIMTLPPKFAECTSLRYLNLKSNLLQEFPQAVCRLKALEILDLRSNKLRQIPGEIRCLTSLKVLSIQANRIEKLPSCLGEMPVLQCVRFSDNPISFPPPEILALDPSERPLDFGNQLEIDTLLTGKLKEYFRSYSALERSGTESGDSSNGSPQPSESSRPLKRAASGRFPVKISTSSGTGTDSSSDARSSIVPRLPSHPSSSHYRGASQHNATLRRPVHLPPAVAMSNERNRSNSESLLQANRNKRMGMVTRKTSDLGTVDESKSNRLSHVRGFSHSSAIQNRSSHVPVKHRTGSSTDSGAVGLARTGVGSSFQRLSSLPEQKPGRPPSDDVHQAAKILVTAFIQLQPIVSHLVEIIKIEAYNFEAFEGAVVDATAHLETLDSMITRAAKIFESGDERDCLIADDLLLKESFEAIASHRHVVMLMQEMVPSITSKCEPQFLRSLMHNVYGFTMEIRSAMQILVNVEGMELTGAAETPSTANSTRNDLPSSNQLTEENARVHEPHSSSGSISTTASTAVEDTGLQPYPAHFSSRSPSLTSQPSTLDSVGADGESMEFEKVYVKLAKALAISLDALPAAEEWFSKVIEYCHKVPTSSRTLDLWNSLLEQCTTTIGYARTLETILQSSQCKDPAFRNQPDFWQLCNAFVTAFVDMAMTVKEANSRDLIQPMLLTALRPVQKAVKAVSLVIDNSPWKSLSVSGPPFLQNTQKQPPTAITHAMIQAGLTPNANGVMTTSTPSTTVSSASHTASSSSASISSTIPATPLSAALGPAVQATVPTNGSISRSNTTFSGNVYERADSLLSSRSRVTVTSPNEPPPGAQSNRFVGRPHGSTQ